MKITIHMDGDMHTTYATSLLRQHQFPENFKFYFKRKLQKNNQSQQTELWNLVRPRLRIAIVTEIWPVEMKGVVLSIMQLCQGLQGLGHKILLVRPAQQVACSAFHPEQECLVASPSIPKYSAPQCGGAQYLKVSKAFEQFSPDVVHIVTEGPLGLTALQVAQAGKIAISSGFHSPFQELGRFFDLAFLLQPIQRYFMWFHNSTDLTCVPNLATKTLLRQCGMTCRLVVLDQDVQQLEYMFYQLLKESSMSSG